MEAEPDAPQRLILNGTEAFSLVALAGGCRFVAAYPMTPGSPVLHFGLWTNENGGASTP